MHFLGKFAVKFHPTKKRSQTIEKALKYFESYVVLYR